MYITKGKVRYLLNVNLDTKVVCEIDGVPTAEEVKYKGILGIFGRYRNKVRGFPAGSTRVKDGLLRNSIDNDKDLVKV